MCSSLFSLTVGTSSLKQAQALPPSSPQLLLATLWQQAQCTPLLPGRYLGILYPAQPSSSRNPPSTAHGGKMNFSPYCPSVRKSTCKHTLWLYSEFQEFGEYVLQMSGKNTQHTLHPVSFKNFPREHRERRFSQIHTTEVISLLSS